MTRIFFADGCLYYVSKRKAYYKLMRIIFVSAKGTYLKDAMVRAQRQIFYCTRQRHVPT